PAATNRSTAARPPRVSAGAGDRWSNTPRTPRRRRAQRRPSTTAPSDEVPAPSQSVDRAARILRGVTQGFLDPQQLVVLRHAIGARRAAGLDLARPSPHRQIGDERILRFAAPV